MYGKKYSTIIEYIGILRKSGVALKELDEFQSNFQLESMRYRDRGEKVFDKMLTTRGIIGKLNMLVKKYPKTVQAEFNKIPLHFNNTEDYTKCEMCKGELLVKSGNAICELCGFNKNIGQVYYGSNAQKKQYKSRETMDHYCEMWLEHLQGKGVFNLPTEIYNKLLESANTKCRGMPQYVNEIKCIDIRRWLYQLKSSKYNKYIPAIHHRITRDLGNEISPPQFTEEEKQIIIRDWKYLATTYCQEYKKLKPRSNKKRNNIPYYPICILFIVSKRFADEERVKQFETYVHKQSSDTYRLRLQCWEETCRILNYTGSGKY
jgi:hypothetical protein